MKNQIFYFFALTTFLSVAIDAMFSLIKLLLYYESNSNYDLSKVGYITENEAMFNSHTNNVSWIPRINLNLLPTDDRRGLLRETYAARCRHVKRYRTSICQSSQVHTWSNIHMYKTHTHHEAASYEATSVETSYSDNCYYRVTGLIRSIKCKSRRSKSYEYPYTIPTVVLYI